MTDFQVGLTIYLFIGLTLAILFRYRWDRPLGPMPILVWLTFITLWPIVIGYFLIYGLMTKLMEIEL